MSESQPGPPAPDASSEAAAAVSARDAGSQPRLAASPFELSQEPVTPEGEVVTPDAGAVPAPAYEHLGELPATYGTQSVYVVAYDPHQLFAYWDVDWASVGKTPKDYALHVCRADGEVESRSEISSADAGRYLAVTRPGGTYYVELGRRERDGRWQPLAFSGRVTMPPAGLSGETEAKFATLPFHLSFQRLLELIETTMGRGEDLTAALARLQRGDHPAATAKLLHTLDRLEGEQVHTLELLLGQKFAVSSAPATGGGSETAVLRDRHEVLSSGGGFGSEARLATGAGGSENLSSGAFDMEFGSVGPLGGSETLSAFVAGLNSETLSSFGWGSEALNSEAWRMAAGGPGADSAGVDSERAEMFRRALGNHLDTLGSLFSAVSAGLSSGFGSETASGGLSSPGGW